MNIELLINVFYLSLSQELCTYMFDGSSLFSAHFVSCKGSSADRCR